MSRDDGFLRADVSVHLYDDDKVKALYRELAGDLGRMGHAMMLAEVTLLASWRDGKRRTVHEAAPLWLTVDDDLVAVLVTVGLLDRTGRRPAGSWRTWFGPAHERREARRQSGALGGLRGRGQRPYDKAVEMLNQGRKTRKKTPSQESRQDANHPLSEHSDATATLTATLHPTSTPSYRRSSRARARGDAPSNGADRERRPGSLRDAMTAMGLALPTTVEPMPANADASADAPGESWFEPAAKAGGAE